MLGIDMHETVRNLEETRWRLRLREYSGKRPFRYIRAAASLPSHGMPLTACEGFGYILHYGNPTNGILTASRMSSNASKTFSSSYRRPMSCNDTGASTNFSGEYML